MEDAKDNQYDVVIVGTGLAGAIVAAELGKIPGLKILMLEAGEAIPTQREELMERFYLSTTKTPDAPYGNNPNARSPTVLELGRRGNTMLTRWKASENTYLDQSESRLPFGSTYERRSGGTMWHWMGTCLRFLPRDFRLKEIFGVGENWPITYEELSPYYNRAEYEIGVSAAVSDQTYHGVTFTEGYSYPNPAIPESVVDQFFREGLKGERFEEEDIFVSKTPAGRNSRPYQNRRVCAGNTNCVPICPIGAKYDATITLHRAFNTGRVEVLYQCVASKVLFDENQVTGIEYIRYQDAAKRSPIGPPQKAPKAKIYVLAANAIETPRLLLSSGYSHSSLGANLMDHPFFLQWGLAPKKVYPFRGPLSTSGIESLRDRGNPSFRKDHSAFRIEIGNDGWALSAFDPARTTLDWIDGTNTTETNSSNKRLYGRALRETLNGVFTRQCRIGFELEQLPLDTNRVTLSSQTDALGLPRPKIHYDLSEYEKKGFVAAKRVARKIFDKLGIEPKSKQLAELRESASYFQFENEEFEYYGAGHVIGTYRMGDDAKTSVVNKYQRCHSQGNLYLLGSGVFPTSGTANPSLTIAALSFWAAETIAKQLTNSAA